MRIGYLAGALDAGGAERQIVYLAQGMAQRGHDVEIFSYAGPGEFDRLARDAGIQLRISSSRTLVAKLLSVRAWARSFRPDLIHGVMKRASSLAILANTPRRFRVIGNDLSTATYDPDQRALRVAIQLFRFADRVTTQTATNRASLIRLAPWLAGKVVVVRNAVDLDRFCPGRAPAGDAFVFLCVGTVWRAKNPVNVVRAVNRVRELWEGPFRVIWVGRYRDKDGGEIPEYAEAAQLIREWKLEGVMEFRGLSDRIADAYHTAHALLHASIQDGIPNAVVEGMASGLPLVVSPVSDLPELVAEGNNGFLSDSFEGEAIASAMLNMLRASDEERREMAVRSRELAERWFGMKRFLDDYESTYRDATGEGVSVGLG